MEKILGNFCFSEQIFYRKESFGAPGLDKTGALDGTHTMTTIHLILRAVVYIKAESFNS